MKKLKYMILIGIMAIVTGCGVPKPQETNPLLQSDYLIHDYDYRNAYDQVALEQLVILLQAVEQQDAAAVKAMFSKKAQDEIEDLDEKIEVLIRTFPEWQTNYEPDFSGYGAHTNRGVNTRWSKPTFQFQTDGRRYALHFCYYYEADEDPDMLGMYLIQIRERDQIYGNGVHTHTDGEKSSPDIYLWDYTMPLADRKPLMGASPFRVYMMTDEEKYAYLDTMTGEEEKLILRDTAKIDRFHEKTLYTHQISQYYVALHELRFAKEYIGEHYPDREVVYESVEVNTFDNSILFTGGPDMVVVHLADDPHKQQYFLNLTVEDDEVTVTSQKLFPEE